MNPDPTDLFKILSGKTLLLCHHNADPDSLCSAFAFQKLAEKVKPSMNSVVFLPGGVSRSGKKVMDALGIDVEKHALESEVDSLVVFDTATLQQLEEWGPLVVSLNVPKVFIDHHAPHPQVIELASLFFGDEEATSTCELVYDLYRSLGITPTPRVAKALLVGIAFDSKHFTTGTGKSFNTISELLKLGVPLAEILELLNVYMDRSEKIARLKAGQRTEIFEVEGWLAVATVVSSFQASVARGLIALGADMAVVVGGEKEQIRVSLRSTDRFYRSTSIHLGRDIAYLLGEEFKGSGSGHSTAAGVNAKGNPRLMLVRAMKLLSEKIQANARA